MPSCCVYPFATNLALYFAIVPSRLNLTLKIHLQLITFQFGGKVVKFQVWFFFNDFSSSLNAFFQRLTFAPNNASYMLIGSLAKVWLSNHIGFFVDVNLPIIVSISLEGGFLCLTSLLGLVMGESV